MAKERALSAEEEYITRQLQNTSCDRHWDMYGATGEKQATVINRTADGVYVDVVDPYYVTTDAEEVDAISEAQYFVTEEIVQRVTVSDVYSR